MNLKSIKKIKKAVFKISMTNNLKTVIQSELIKPRTLIKKDWLIKEDPLYPGVAKLKQIKKKKLFQQKQEFQKEQVESNVYCDCPKNALRKRRKMDISYLYKKPRQTE